MINLVWNEETNCKKSYIAQGREEGRAKSNLEMVKNLLLAKTPMQYIVQATGWTKEEILKISAELKG